MKREKLWSFHRSIHATWGLGKRNEGMTTILWSLVQAAFQIIYQRERERERMFQTNSLFSSDKTRITFNRRVYGGGKEVRGRRRGSCLRQSSHFLSKGPQVVSELVFWLPLTARMIPLFLDINQYILKLLLSIAPNRDRYFRKGIFINIHFQRTMKSCRGEKIQLYFLILIDSKDCLEKL